MAFILPNGTVVDLDRMDRDAVLAAAADRRRLAQQDRNSARTAQIQGQALTAEAESSAAEREQTARLAESEMAQRERMAGAAERSLDNRLKAERDANREAFSQEQLRMVDEEQAQADGVAKRLNDMLAEWDAMRPDPKKDPDKFLEWQRGRGRIRQQVPINLEGALIEDGGVWKVDPTHFKVKRSRWLLGGPVDQGAKGAEVSGIAAALAKASGAPPAVTAPPSMAVMPTAPVVPAVSTAPVVGIPEALGAQAAAMPGFIPGYGMPMGGPAMSSPTPPSLDIGRALQMVAQIFGRAGGVSPGGQPFNLPRNNPLPTIGKYQTFGVQ